MKKLGFLNKVPSKCESSASPEFDQVKAGKIGWTGRLGDAKRALSRKAKGFSFPLTSSSTYAFSTAPPPPKRAPSTTLTLRSKSMTAELEELGECERGWIQTQTSLLPAWSLFCFHFVKKSLLLACSFHFHHLFFTKLLLGEDEEVSLMTVISMQFLTSLSFCNPKRLIVSPKTSPCIKAHTHRYDYIIACSRLANVDAVSI